MTEDEEGETGEGEGDHTSARLSGGEEGGGGGRRTHFYRPHIYVTKTATTFCRSNRPILCAKMFSYNAGCGAHFSREHW